MPVTLQTTADQTYQDWQHDHYDDSFVLEEVDLLEKVYPDEGRQQVTAIVSTFDKHTAESIVKRLCEYDMFHSFIVWNDNSNNNNNELDIKGCSRPLAVINHPFSRKGPGARYYACHAAKTPYCFFQDTLNDGQSLRSVYANFLKSPQLIHGESGSHDAYVDSQWRYCFSNEDIQLHACYVNMGSGTFIAKEMASQFIGKYDANEYADIYFTIYMNQIPYQLEGHGSLKKTLGVKEIEHMNLGLNTLYNHLKKQGTGLLKPYVDSLFDRNARVSCKRDQCLFLTNKQVLPDIQLFSYNPTVGIQTSKQMHDDYITDHYQEHFYAHAVDDNDMTSWKSIQNIHAGDYIGLDLLMPIRTPLKYRFVVHHPYYYKNSLRIQISYNGLEWIKLYPSPHLKCQNADINEQLLECHFIVRETGYRYIRLESVKDFDFKFDVYDISFSAKVKKDEDGQLLDISLDNGIAFVEDK
ncbi:hypothetical protein BCV72DRAFT_238681 [Rhizopus microsporus var. microsporus]|uniref:F5/8 type C domain-containing protein n=2 Tax=Rhizopus microsporus TaxID=58291 RepID=A0A2G4SN53_RHIZD|nr:uncharacterized protein RHIMIDRAFT_245339 [Rhizopus microsporus ATCC 52813]ORE10545.1 hypothetical protein BCV72DRAFT_238681 [Rhizopus microsporus var. microsporus]PHZ10217.1 hypothetical protein RHIMIDRAFT_245339 [Rhizopus microsporus ATCC 52813]